MTPQRGRPRPKRAFSQKEPSAEKSLQPKRAISQKEPSAEKSLQPKRAISQKEPPAKKSLQLKIFKFKNSFCLQEG